MTSRSLGSLVRRTLVPLFLVALIGLSSGPIRSAWAEGPKSTASSFVVAGTRTTVWVPGNAGRTEPATVVLALHGMGGSGEKIAEGLVEEADRRGWLLVAPTIPYAADWKNTDRLTQDEVGYTRTLTEILDALPAQTGLKLKPRVFVFGFSRGAQLAQRFAFFYPERVRAVAALSGGSYTTPRVVGLDGKSELDLPLGLGDCAKQLGRPAQLGQISRQVRFLIEVGANDNKDADVPRPFDTLLGKNRLERARTFNRLLGDAGIKSRLVVVPDVGHLVAPAMRAEAVSFFEQTIADEKAWSLVLY